MNQASVIKKVKDNRTLSRIGVRGVTVVCRFALLSYIANAMSMRELGIYGLVAGVIGMAPAVTGWGLCFVLSRLIVRADDQERANLIRDRLTVSIITTSLFVLVAVPPLIVWSTFPLHWILLVAALFVLEALASDIDKCLLAINEADWVIWLVFVRTGLWVLPLVVAGAIFPSLNTLTFVLSAWGLFHLVSLVLALLRLKRLPFQFRVGRVGEGFPDRIVRVCFPIYIYALSLVGLTYIERYLVALALGLEAAGLFTFAWSLCNSIVSLINTCLLHPAMYALVDLSNKDMREWQAKLKTVLRQVMLITFTLSVATMAGFVVLQHFWTKFQVSNSVGFMAVLLVGCCFRVLSDSFGVAFYSLGKDRVLLGTGVIALCGLCLLSYLGALYGGILGAAGANAGIFILLAIIRFRWLPSESTDVAQKDSTVPGTCLAPSAERRSDAAPSFGANMNLKYDT